MRSKTKIRTKFPYEVREIPHGWIPLSDGTRLAARLWLPVSSETTKVPGLLEYIPYRKNDWNSILDASRHAYFAGHGYACVRVDMRGAGESDGILLDEYLEQEQRDAVEVIEWIANQPWCDGAVGMIGRSWGGFNSLQVAACRPKHLRAIISICSSDDRYSDDVHYIGGCVLGHNMLSWASMMLAYNSRPPDPKLVGQNWREIWIARMEQSPPFIEKWLEHQRRDAYWKHGSVCENYANIQAPVYAVGGWVDGYPSAVLRLLAGLSVPKKGLIGPWGHDWPQEGKPGPAIGFLQEALRWWDHWLKGQNTGVMEEPPLRVWMQDSVEPKPDYDVRPGRWIAEPVWPSPNVVARHLHLHGCSLTDKPGEATHSILGTQHTGIDAGEWCAWGSWGGVDNLPVDQRGEDGRSLTFTSDPLQDDLEILGFPEASLRVSCDQSRALVVARLCDVAPNGASTLVTRGLLNLTHRNSHEQPELLQPGVSYNIRVQMRAIAYAFPKGHRVRLSVSPTYWPWAWPSPDPVTLTLQESDVSFLQLPIRPVQSSDKDLRPFREPESALPLEHTLLRQGGGRRLSYAPALGLHKLVVDIDQLSSRRIAWNQIELNEKGTDTYSIVDGNPLSASVESERTIGIGRGEWQTRVHTTSSMSADRTHFYLTNALEAFEGDTRVFVKSWTHSVPRDSV
jgi:putative CocE/NonD family hydrolase